MEDTVWFIPQLAGEILKNQVQFGVTEVSFRLLNFKHRFYGRWLLLIASVPTMVGSVELLGEELFILSLYYLFRVKILSYTLVMQETVSIFIHNKRRFYFSKLKSRNNIYN